MFKIKNIFSPKLKLVRGTRLTSALFIGTSIALAAGILWGANMYYDIDTGKIIVQEVQNVISTVTPQFKVAYDTALTKYLQISVADTGKTTLSTSHGLDITAAATSTWKTTSGPLTIKTEGTGADLYIDSSGDIRATSTQSIYLTAGQDFNITFGADRAFSLLRGTTKYMGIDATGLTLSTSTATTTIKGSKIVLSGTSQVDGTLTVSATSTGAYDVTFYGTSTANYMLWDQSDNKLVITGTANATSVEIAAGDVSVQGKITVGTDGAGYNVTFYGDTAGTKLEWDDVNKKLVVTGVSNAEALRIAAGNATIAAGSLAITNPSTQATTALTVIQSTTTQNIVEFRSNSQNLAIRIDASGNIFITGSATTTIATAAGDLIFDAGSGAVRVAASDTFYVDGIAVGGEGTLIGIVPIFGFDLPAQTATTSFVKISRTIENYPFPTAATGTSRFNKLVIRYSATSTLTDNAVQMRVSTSTGVTYYSFYLPRPASNDIEKGEARIVSVSLPTTTIPWWLDTRNATTSAAVRIFQIFLAAFDVKQ